MDKQTLISKINGVDLSVINCENGPLVPVKPICRLLGIDHSAQIARLKEDERFNSTVVLCTTVGEDNRTREMVCLPVPFVLLWLGNINPANVSEEARPAILKYSVECAMALYNHFIGLSRRRQEENAAEIALLEEISELNEKIAEGKSRLKECKSNLAKLRASRLDEQPSLFD